jgi:hypothetical protein
MFARVAGKKKRDGEVIMTFIMHRVQIEGSDWLTTVCAPIHWKR